MKLCSVLFPLPTVSLKLALWTKLVVLGQPRWPAHNIVPEKGIIYPKINVLNVSSGTELIRTTFEYIQMLFILLKRKEGPCMCPVSLVGAGASGCGES